MDFSKGRSSPCSFYHKGKQLKCVVHGDDFLVEGELCHLRWLEESVSRHFIVKAKYLGPEPECLREVKLLSRLIRWDDEGLTWEPDSRHLKLFVEQLELDASKLTSAGTPSVQVSKKIVDNLIADAMAPVDVFGEHGGEVQVDGAKGDGQYVRQDGASSASPTGADLCKTCFRFSVLSVTI